MDRDLYEVLGVSRTADEATIRSAYRRLAKEHHPDVHGGSPEAEQRFKELQAAYEVLRDPRRRGAYDRYGVAGLRGMGGAGGGNGVDFSDFGDIGELFEELFGLGGRGARARARRGGGPSPERGADMRLKLKLPFEEAVFGTKRTVEVVRRETCEACAGSGAAPGTSPVTCTTCDGLGQVRSVQQSVIGSFVNVQTCTTCHGSGRLVPHPCEACRGRGRGQHTRALEVDLPAGVEKGTQVRLSGEGEHGLWGGPPGDLYLLLDVEPHPTFRRDGDELHLELRVNPADAALGAELTIPSLEGEESIRLSPGTQTGDVVRVRDRGVPRLRGGGRGDLVVTVFVMTPEKLTHEQRDLLEQLRRTLPRAEVARQERASFWSRVRERFG